MNQIKIVVCEVGKKPEVRLVENTLETFQAIVGGYIECLNVGLGIMLICDEEGKLKGKPHNFSVRGDQIVGDVCFVGTDGSPDFVSLTDSQIKILTHGE